MSDILNNLSEEEIAAYSAMPEGERHIVVGSNRVVTVPEELKRIGVQYDHNIETVTFDCPRYWDGHDMSKMVVYINYMTPDGVFGAFVAQNVRVDANDISIMHFDWTISKHVTRVNGNLSFLVCVKNVDDNGRETNHWNSELNKDLYISEGLEADEPILDEGSDVVTQILLRLSAVEQQLENGGSGGAMVFKDIVEELPETANEGDVYKLNRTSWELHSDSVLLDSPWGASIYENDIYISRTGDSGTFAFADDIASAAEKVGKLPAPIKIVSPSDGIEFIINYESQETTYYPPDGGAPEMACNIVGKTTVEGSAFIGGYREDIAMYYAKIEAVTYVYHNGEWIDL